MAVSLAPLGLDVELGPLALAGLAFTALMTFYAWYPHRRFRLRHIPGPFGWPLLGNLIEVQALDLAPFLLSLPDFGPVAKFWWGTRPIVIISDPDVARRAAVRYNYRGQLNSFFSSTPTGPHLERESAMLFFSGPDTWRPTRRVFDQALLHPAKLAAYVPHMTASTDLWLVKLRAAASAGLEVELAQEATRLLTETVGRCVYGLETTSELASEADVDAHARADQRGGQLHAAGHGRLLAAGKRIAAASNNVFRSMDSEHQSAYVTLMQMFPEAIPLWRRLAAVLPDRGQRMADAARAELSGVAQALMAQWRASRSAGDGAGGPSPISSTSFLVSLMAEGEGQAGAEGKALARSMTDLEREAQLVMFTVASIETTAAMLAFVCFHLAASPEVQARVAAEARAWDQRRQAAEGTGTGDAAGAAGAEAERLLAEVLGEESPCPWLDASLKEAQRLHPAAVFVMRHVTDEGCELGGKWVPSGTALGFNIIAWQRSPAYWPRPDEFLPQRFLPEGAAQGLAGSQAGTHTPFGLGARMCPGYKFALLEAKLSLLSLLSQFSLSPGPSQRVDPQTGHLFTKTGFTHVPRDGVWVRLAARD